MVGQGAPKPLRDAMDGSGKLIEVCEVGRPRGIAARRSKAVA